MPDEGTSGAQETYGHNHRQRTRPVYGRKPGRSRPKTYAAVDVGTNNCRLLIAKPTKSGFRVIDSYSKIVRLGVGLSETGRLSDQSMEAALDALKTCSKKMQARSVKRWRCVATEACRQAENGDEFLKTVKSETGLALEIISPRVEARLSVMGCINLIDSNKKVALVVDIGGGSTELSWVDVRKLRHTATSMRIYRPPISAWASIPLGVVTLSELVPERDDKTRWYSDLKDKVRAAFHEVGCAKRFAKVFESGQGHIIGTSGTITSLAGIYLKLPTYQREKVDGLWISTHDVVSVARDMASRTPEGRAEEPCIGAERARLLVAGCAITDVICELWPCQSIRVGDRGLREGILMGLMRQRQALDFSENQHDG